VAVAATLSAVTPATTVLLGIGPLALATLPGLLVVVALLPRESLLLGLAWLLVVPAKVATLALLPLLTGLLAGLSPGQLALSSPVLARRLLLGLAGLPGPLLILAAPSLLGLVLLWLLAVGLLLEPRLLVGLPASLSALLTSYSLLLALPVPAALAPRPLVALLPAMALLADLLATLALHLLLPALALLALLPAPALRLASAPALAGLPWARLALTGVPARPALSSGPGPLLADLPALSTALLHTLLTLAALLTLSPPLALRVLLTLPALLAMLQVLASTGTATYLLLPGSLSTRPRLALPGLPVGASRLPVLPVGRRAGLGLPAALALPLVPGRVAPAGDELPRLGVTRLALGFLAHFHFELLGVSLVFLVGFLSLGVFGVVLAHNWSSHLACWWRWLPRIH
jgi:hypothetical protein